MGIESINKEEQFLGNNWILPTDIGLVTTADDALGKKLEVAGWDLESDEVLDIQVAFREALINAIAHGNLDVSIPDGSFEELGVIAKAEQERNPTDKKVFVDIDLDENKVEIRIRDEGKGFNWREVADPTTGEGLLKPKGRGMLFMKSYADSVIYNEQGNEVTLVKTKK
ncbi:MAG: ATP-binding protein [Patescibacteria group bacterium]